MIRANLLPKRKRYRLGPWSVSTERVRELTIVVLTVLTVAGAGTAFQSWRIAQARAIVSELDASVERQSPRRAECQRLALEVAHLEELARRQAQLERTGARTALAIAAIGNLIPREVWLQSLGPAEGGYALSGRASRLVDVSAMLAALDRSLPHQRARLLALEDDGHAPARFDVRLEPGKR